MIVWNQLGLKTYIKKLQIIVKIYEAPRYNQDKAERLLHLMKSGSPPATETTVS